MPTLLITSLDDSFLSENCYPFDLAKNNPNFSLMVTKYGGHVGFVTSREHYWDEEVINHFLSN